MSFLRRILATPSRRLSLVLVIALIHALVYVFVVPPWQHYDEPNHFEYAWWLANRHQLPKPGNYDNAMRRAVAVSMIDHGFFRGLGFLPDLESKKPIWIGTYSQLRDPPFYYLLVSLPLQDRGTADVTGQLYAGRLVSVLLFLVSLLAAWGVVGELLPDGHPLQLLLPLSLALLPGYVDLMTAVNNDVGVVALMGLTLWGCLRIVRRGVTPLRLLVTATAAGLALWTKSSAGLALPLLLVSLLFGLLRARWRWLAWALVALGVVAGLGLALSWRDAAGWYRSTAQSQPTRARSPQAVLGDYVLQLQAGAPVTPRWLVPLFQPVPLASDPAGRSRNYTLAGWMWSDQPISLTVTTPQLSDGRQAYASQVTISQQPSFFAFSVTLPDRNYDRLWVSLDPGAIQAGTGAMVYYDGLVLAEGKRPPDEIPQFYDAGATSGEWGGWPFRNLLRNASAERAGVGLRPALDALGSRFMADQTRPNLVMTSLLDWPGAGWYYQLAAATIFRTFWARFGWGHVPLLGHKPYRWLGLFTLLGIAGALYYLGWRIWRRQTPLPWDLALILLLLLAGVWFSALVRGIIYIGFLRLYIPVARYVYPAIIPAMLILVAGWYAGLNALRRRLHLLSWSPYLVIIMLFLGLDVWSIVSILHFY